MVHSMAFMIKQQMDNYLMITNQIDKARENLSKQASDIQLQIENETVCQLNAVQKKREDCLSQLDQIIEEQYQVLDRKTVQIKQKVAELNKMLRIAESSGDNQGVRGSFERLMKDSIQFEDFKMNDFSISFSVNKETMKDASDKLGTLFVQKAEINENYEQTYCSEYSVLPQNENYGCVDEQEDDTMEDEMTSLSHGQLRCNTGLNKFDEFCDISRSFNCLKLCEDGLTSDTKSVLPALDAAKDVDGWQIVDGNQKSLIEAENENLSNWLVRKEVRGALDATMQDVADLQENEQPRTKSSQHASRRIHDQINEDCDEIRNKSLDKWLKPTTPSIGLFRVLQTPPNKNLISKQVDDTFCLNKWLKRDKIMDIEEIAESSLPSKKPFTGSLQCIYAEKVAADLKGEEVGPGRQGNRNCQIFSNIQCQPLHCWLKKTQSVLLQDVRDKQQNRRHLENTGCGKGPLKFKVEDKMDQHQRLYIGKSKMSLNKWLSASGSRECSNKHGMNSPRQINRSELQLWLKKPAVLANPKCSLCKWLVEKYVGNCSKCTK